MLLASIKKAQYKNRVLFLKDNLNFSHPDFTVGVGISPTHAKIALVFYQLADYTAGMELHQTPKRYNIFTS